jgi:hypothetical protein
MIILPYVDLGKAFESLKNTMIEVEKEAKEDAPTIFDTANKYAKAYGRLSGAVQCHIAVNTDTSFHFLEEALKTPEKPLSEAAIEAPTLLLYDQTHWQEEEEGYPDIIPHRNDK